MAKYRKAVAALVTPLIAWAALKLGLELDPDVSAALIALVAGLVVERIPNDRR